MDGLSPDEEEKQASDALSNMFNALSNESAESTNPDSDAEGEMVTIEFSSIVNKINTSTLIVPYRDDSTDANVNESTVVNVGEGGDEDNNANDPINNANDPIVVDDEADDNGRDSVDAGDRDDIPLSNNAVRSIGAESISVTLGDGRKISLKPASLNKKAFVDIISESRKVLVKKNLMTLRHRSNTRSRLELQLKKMIQDKQLMEMDETDGRDLSIAKSIKRLERLLQLTTSGPFRQRRL